LWRRVLHTLLIRPLPLETLLFTSPRPSESLSEEGIRNVSTWPLERPTVRTGSVGWTAWVNRSEVKGRVHRFSNMVRVGEGYGCERLN
jgi:hypothetical protein